MIDHQSVRKGEKKSITPPDRTPPKKVRKAHLAGDGPGNSQASRVELNSLAISPIEDEGSDHESDFEIHSKDGNKF